MFILICIAIFILLICLFITLRTIKPSEKFYAQFGEDKFLSNFFDPSYIGACVEVGAHDGVTGSNTNYFEKKGWRTLCIEPDPSSFTECEKNRKECVKVAISQEDFKKLPFTIYTVYGNNAAVSSLKPDLRMIKDYEKITDKSYTIEVLSRNLTSLLDEQMFPRKIDIISVDTEGTELDVLKSIDFKKYDVTFLLVENNYEDSDCENYLKNFGYKKIKRTGVNDIYKKQY